MKKFHLDKTHLSFYAIAITSVLVLFKIVSSYGETNLKAPPDISGNYQIQSSSLPACFKNQDLQLKIEQSGVFLLAHLANHPLDGRIRDNQIALSGHPSNWSDCSFDNTQNTGPKIKGNVTDDTFLGEITWDGTTPKTRFTAKREVVKEPSEKSHH